MATYPILIFITWPKLEPTPKNYAVRGNSRFASFHATFLFLFILQINMLSKKQNLAIAYTLQQYQGVFAHAEHVGRYSCKKRHSAYY